MRRQLAFTLTLLAVVTAPAGAASVLTYKGKATSMDRSFKYGKVTVKRRGDKVTNLKIEAVTTTGCGGFMTLVFAPSDPEMEIVSGSARIRNGKLSVKYRPTRDVESQTTTIKATFTGSKVTGTFKSGDLCGNEGRFTARR